MATNLAIHDYEIRSEPRFTSQCYARIAVPGPETCGCAFCENWVEARSTVVTPGIREFLGRFSIPDDGEIEVWQAPGTSKANLYGGWYMFVGSVLARPDGDGDFRVDDFQVSFKDGYSYAIGAFEGFKVSEIHFWTEIDSFIDPERLAK